MESYALEQTTLLESRKIHQSPQIEKQASRLLSKPQL